MENLKNSLAYLEKFKENVQRRATHDMVFFPHMNFWLLNATWVTTFVLKYIDTCNDRPNFTFVCQLIKLI